LIIAALLSPSKLHSSRDTVGTFTRDLTISGWAGVKF
jgi:hypothetical protein